MPRFHFNVYEGVSLPDKKVTDLPDIPAGRKEGSRIAGLLLQESHETFWGDGDWRMEITDESGLLLLRLDVNGTHSPAALNLVPHTPLP